MNRLNLALALLNLVLLAFLAIGGATAARDDRGVLRARALEIVDDQGRVRASIVVHPASVAKDGTAWPDTAVLRLVDADGGPGVKIASSRKGAIAAFIGEQGTYAQVGADAGGSFVKLTNKGVTQDVKP
jgi:hypothetical protein